MSRSFRLLHVALIFYLAFCIGEVTFGQLFPEEIQTRIDNGEYTLLDSVNIIGGEVYFFLDDDSRERFAVRYELGIGSGFENPSAQPITFSGSIWLAGLSTYTATDIFSCEFLDNGTTSCVCLTTYLEQVEPIEFPYSVFNAETIKFGISTDALVLGEAAGLKRLLDDFPLGNMSVSGVDICIGAGCEIGACVRLVGLYFEQTGAEEYSLTVDSSDFGRKVFENFQGSGGEFGKPYVRITQRFNHVAACIPEDPTGILGDVNGDGQVNLLDVSPFVCALENGLYIFEADVVPDGEINLFDVFLFISLLL